MEIYYEKAGQKVGPIDTSQLEPNSINQNTLIWYIGLDEWIKAEDVSELSTYFQSTPPPLPSAKKISRKEKYDAEYNKDTDATIQGILVIGLMIGIFIFKNILLPDVHPGYFVGLVALIHFGCAFYAGKLAKTQNRNEGGWFVFAFFLHGIALIIIGQLPKLKEKVKSEFEKELDKVSEYKSR